MKKPKIAIIGLGYVGLPLAVEFAKKYQVIGFDINTQRIQELRDANDTTLETSSEELKAVNANSYKEVENQPTGLWLTDNMNEIEMADCTNPRR